MMCCSDCDGGNVNDRLELYVFWNDESSLIRREGALLQLIVIDA